jgi:hypothetical protein
MFSTNELFPYIVVAGCLLMAGEGSWRILRAVRARSAGDSSRAVFRAALVWGIAGIVFLPLLVVVVRFVGYLAGIPLLIAFLAIGIWADETTRDPNVNG